MLQKNPDISVFGIDNIKKCRRQFIILYIIAEDGIVGIPNDEIKKKILYSTFLMPYDGAVDVLYY